ncbi:MAG TPA: polysaccharide deacetylase family protein [Casimicrobiaceae bacterium]|nr:polysaccharide deacetylase family protein [Casimicrobiaceae bacterium]
MYLSWAAVIRAMGGFALRLAGRTFAVQSLLSAGPWWNMIAFVLLYHSHRILGPDYQSNDHVAFARDLCTIAETGCRIVSLSALVNLIGPKPLLGRILRSRHRYVALTFDDGPEYDAVDFDHPIFGHQRSFLGAMQDFRATREGHAQRSVCATSFVIASPSARKIMETEFDPRETYLTEGSLSDDWWTPAIDSGMLSIANHSWDHLHPGLPTVAHSRQAKGDFREVDTEGDADAQITDAFRYILSRTAGRATPYFAYPFGHYNDFLVNEFLPKHQHHGMRAAFSIDGRAVDSTTNIWCIPRFTCGLDWRSPGELARILAG